MGDRFQNKGFAANYSSKAFKILGNGMQFVGGHDSRADTILRLNSPGGSVPFAAGFKRKWSLIDPSLAPQAASPLSLGLLGRASCSSDSTATACTTMSSAKETDDESSMDLELDFSLHLSAEKLTAQMNQASSDAKSQPKVDLELSLSMGPTESEITSVHPNPGLFQSEGSSPCLWNSGFGAPPLAGNFLFKQMPQNVLDLSSNLLTMPKNSVTCTSGLTNQLQTHHRSVTSKTCQVEGCGKGARGASGRCISHGGGRRCQKQGCQKGAEGRTVYCKAHGGGRRCEHLGCTKSAEGRTDFCIAHGGGRRCSNEGCTRAARGKSGLCIRHGGGKRCQKENCTKSAEGLSGLCISHGGGRRCQAADCTKGAQGSTMYCKAHGGGKRCTTIGCTKGAEGSTPFCKGHGGGKRCAFQGGGICSKSVHGGTNYCVAHGGGKRCAAPDCTKSARGRTDYCVRHGGGKRCKFDGCGKSAQGSTDFCKAHGGGKRCSWAHDCGSCNSFARGKTGLCALHSGLVQDKRVHGGVTLGPLVHDSTNERREKMKDVIVAADDMNVETTEAAVVYEPNGLVAGGPSGSSVGEGRVHGGSHFVKVSGDSSRPMPHLWM